MTDADRPHPQRSPDVDDDHMDGPSVAAGKARSVEAPKPNESTRPVDGVDDPERRPEQDNPKSNDPKGRDLIQLSAGAEPHSSRDRKEAGEDDEKDEKAAGRSGEKTEQERQPLPSKWPFVIAAVILVALLAWSGYSHWSQRREALNTRDDTANFVPEVRTVEAKRNDRPVDLSLPGQTQAFETSTLYARATGYVAQRLVDIGSRVHKGDLLLHVNAPDLDQQLAQAVAQFGQNQASLAQSQAQVGQAEANLNLAKVTFARTNQLTQQGYDTVQNHDNQQANLTTQQANVETAQAGIRVAEANLRSQGATVDRLKALASFEDVKAPFDGVITARNVDVGDLLNADSITGTAMFRIDRDDIIRVSVYVPQSGAIGVREGVDAKVTVAQMPGRVFTGKVTRNSVALTASSRSLMAEIDVPNPDGALRPGLYVTVDLAIPRDHPGVEIPAEALIFNQNGLQVATAQNDSSVKLQTVKIDKDFGTSVELSDGLKGGEKVVLNPPATLTSGSKVKASPRKEDSGQNGQAGQPANNKEAQAASPQGHKD